MNTVGVLFDYNGVLADDEPIHEAAFADVVRPFGIDLTPDVYSRTCLGKTDKAGFEQLAGEFYPRLARLAIADLVELKGNRYRQLARGMDVLFPGAITVVRQLAMSCRLGIVTSAKRDEVVEVLGAAAISSFFAFVVAAEDVQRGKPFPDGYLAGVNRLGLPANRVMVIEDSPSGIAAAKAAGLHCLAVAQTSPISALVDADEVVARVSDIDYELISQLLFER